VGTVRVAGMDIEIQGRLIRIAQIVGDRYVFLDDPKPVLDSLPSCGVRIDLFTFLQRLPFTTPQFSYPMEWDNLAVIRVSTFDQWWNEQIGFKARNKAKQSEKKGVVLREVAFDAALVRGIWEIYNECPVRQGTRFSHYGKTLARVHEDEATFLDKSIFIGAFLGEKLIGFAKLVHDETKTQANLMNIISMVQHRDKASTNALIARAVRSCAERNISFLAYTQMTYGKKQHSSLTDFKERNGFRQIDLPRYYVPMTPLGHIAFRCGLHHRLVDHLPSTIVDKARELRKVWYDRKLQNVTDAS
jgi:hypothetical protein